MSLCSDFMNEQGILQYIGTKLGVKVMLNSKCHAEIAGTQRHIVPEPGTEGEEGKIEFHDKCLNMSFRRSDYRSVNNKFS